MFKRPELEVGRRYRLWLCQRGGARWMEVAEEDASVPAGVLSTALVPHELLLARDLKRIVEQVPLADGTRFVVDAHGIWFTERERAAFRAGADYDQIPWVDGVAPRLAPK